MTDTTTHVVLDAPDRSADWEAGVSFETFLDTAEEYVDLWRGTTARLTVPDDLLERARAVPGTWRLLVLSADWCIDAITTVSAVARLADAAPTLDLRTLDRDDHLGLMDDHLTDGRARSIPVILLLDGKGRERAWWGPRPADLQRWFATEGRALPNDDRYRELRKWYARDRGRATLREIVEMIEAAAPATVG